MGHIGPTAGKFLCIEKVINYVNLANTIPCLVRYVIHLVSLAITMAIL